ncbi:CRISPR-associated protein Csx17 [Haloechinothrix alba]|uniref:CRISPR-associated protein Csx17 n=2 Tax=Haloechinothrix alba TaxID=664784 RepID=A0A238ZY52_9PSEU|nr:CRISPR-associated protein Csx17 [Haloechinothrix alba]
MLCRNEFPDEALAWLDAATVLAGEDDVAFSRLLGTGGNFGRQELAVTYISRVQSAFTDPRSRQWLHALLAGEENVSYLRSPVGQFDPGRAGGIQSSPLEKADDTGFANPWSFLFTLEGALLFAAAVVRRHGAEYSEAAVPFQVRGATGGHATAAPDESVLGELWTPEWTAPARLEEIVQLLGEGRAEWNNHPARSGLDFARAVASLGVDRGIAAFERYVFVDRLGQNPLAIPADRMPVRRRESVLLLADLDGWLDRIPRGSSANVAARVRGVEQALFTHASSGETADFVEVLAALGRAHEAVATSGAARRVVPPLVLPSGTAIADELESVLGEDPELRVALALATAHDDPPEGERHRPTLHGLRPLLSPVTSEQHRPAWSKRPAASSLAAGPYQALAMAARRRAMPRSDDDQNDDVQPAVRGARIAFRHGRRLRTGDVRDLIDGMLDERRVADLLAGLLTIDWRGAGRGSLSGKSASDVALDLLLPFSSTEPVKVAVADGSCVPKLFRPGHQWPALLAAGRADEVLDDAARRLRISGIPHVIRPHHHSSNGERLAAALLTRVREPDVEHALRRVGVLPPTTTDADKEPA